MPHPQIPNQPAGASDFYGGSPTAYGSSVYAGQYLGRSSSGNSGSGRLIRGSDGNWYWPDGSLASSGDIDRYFGALADEDARRYGVDNQYRYDALHSQDADRKAARQQAKRQLAEEQRQYDLSRQDRNRQFDVNTGLDILKTGASLRGPLDAFQGAAYARGIQTGGLAPYLQSLRTTGTTSYGGGTATTGNPVPLTVGTLADSLAGGGAYNPNTGPSIPGVGATGQTGAGGAILNGPAQGGNVDAYGRPTLDPTYQANLDAINKTAQGGLANLKLGALENLSPSELGTFKSGLGYLGRDVDSELTFYKRSRPGQGSAVSA